MFTSTPGTKLPTGMTFKRPTGAHVDEHGILRVGDKCPDCGKLGKDYASGALYCDCLGSTELNASWSPDWLACPTCYLIADGRIPPVFICGHVKALKAVRKLMELCNCACHPRRSLR